jgi:hypothetical protein
MIMAYFYSDGAIGVCRDSEKGWRTLLTANLQMSMKKPTFAS